MENAEGAQSHAAPLPDGRASLDEGEREDDRAPSQADGRDGSKTIEELLAELHELRRRVAELEASESALRASEVMYHSLVDTIDDTVHVKDTSGRYILVNEAITRRSGVSREEMLGKTVVDVYGPEVGAKLLEEDRTVALSGIPVDDEHQHNLPTGVRVDHVRKAPLRNERGEVVGIVTVSRDVTARRQAEDAIQRERDFSSAVIDTIGNLLIVLDRQATIVQVNRAFERIAGYSSGDAKGQPAWKIIPSNGGEDQGKLAFAATLAGQFPNSGENYLTTRDGRKRLIAWTNTAISDSSGCVEYVISVGSDITEQRQAEEALRESNARLVKWVDELEQRSKESVLLNRMGDLLQTCLSFEEAYSVIGNFVQKLFPSTAGGLFVISPSRRLVDAVVTWGNFPPSERVFTPDQCWALRRGRVHVVENPDLDLVCRHVDEPLPASYLCVPMMAQGETLGSLHVRIDDESGGVASTKEQLATMVAEHISLALANLTLQQSLRDQAVHDALTGLFNRRYMEEMLERELLRAMRRQNPLSLMMMDIDHFKKFNDIYGHEAGDALLSGVGSYLRTHLRGEDIACRYGGEEIVLILPDSSLEHSRQRAEELRRGIGSLSVEYHRQPLGPVTVSVGVAAFPHAGSNRESLIHAADLALYRAKAEGRDRVVVAQADHSGTDPTPPQ